MTKLSAKLIQLMEGKKMNNQPIQSEESNRELDQGGNMGIQDKITVLKKRFKEYDDNCLDFIGQYDTVAPQLDGLKFLLADKSLELEYRQEFEKRLEFLVNFQKEKYQEYKRVKGLRPEIQRNNRSIDYLKMDYEKVKHFKTQADNLRRDLVLLQQSIEIADREYSKSLQKLEMELEEMWRVSQSDEFIIG